MYKRCSVVSCHYSIAIILSLQHIITIYCQLSFFFVFCSTLLLIFVIYFLLSFLFSTTDFILPMFVSFTSYIYFICCTFVVRHVRIHYIFETFINNTEN